MKDQSNTKNSIIDTTYVPQSSISSNTQTKTNLVKPIILTILVCAVLFGLLGYYLGKTKPNTTNKALPTGNVQYTYESWKPSIGGFVIILPKKWSAVSFDSGPFSEIRIYESGLSWEDAHKETAQKPDMTIFINLDTDMSNIKDFDSELVLKIEESDVVSNEIVIQSEKGPVTIKLSYPKNTNYYKDIQNIIKYINLKPTSSILERAIIIP